MRAPNRHVETSRDRMAVARHAGFGRISVLSSFSGTIAAYGASVLLLGIAAAIVRTLGSESDLTVNDWRDAALGAAVGAGVVLFLAYLVGGYVAGRMARRAGLLHGAVVFGLGIVIAALLGAWVSALDDAENIMREVRSLGIPTSGAEWADIGSVAGILSLVGMLSGALLGGWLGERWHMRLLDRAVDPDVGPEAAAWQEHEQTQARAAETHDDAEMAVERATAGGRIGAGYDGGVTETPDTHNPPPHYDEPVPPAPPWQPAYQGAAPPVDPQGYPQQPYQQQPLQPATPRQAPEVRSEPRPT